jgi:rod shape-determining protein MreD
MSPAAKATLKVLALLAVCIFLQTTFGPDLRVDNVAPDLMMLMAVCAGLAGGPEQGAVVGFAAGFMSDLFLQSTPLGLSALAAALTGFAVGWARVNLFRPNAAMTPLVAGAGTGFGVVVFVVIGYLVGQGQLVAPGKSWLVEVAALEAVYSAVLALPAAMLMGWALGGTSGALSPLGEGSAGSFPELPGRRGSPRAPHRRRSFARARVR